MTGGNPAMDGDNRSLTMMGSPAVGRASPTAKSAIWTCSSNCFEWATTEPSAAISGLAFVDSDDDGVCEAGTGELPLASTSVELLAADGEPKAVTTSSASSV